MTTLRTKLLGLIPPPPDVPPSRQPDIEFIAQRAVGLLEAVATKCDLQSQVTQNIIGSIAAATHLAYLTTLGVQLKPTGRLTGVQQTEREAENVGQSNLIDDALTKAGNFLHAKE